jgi:hypothetical protein
MTTRIRDELERSWPKNNNEMMMKMTPLRALAENAKRVLAETKKFLDEFDEDGIKDDDKDIDRARKEIEQLAGEMRSEKEDVELSFYYHGDEEEEEDALSSSSSLSERKKRNTFAEKFLGGCFPGGVEVKKNVAATAAAALRIRVFDRFSSSSSSSEEEEEKWMTDAIEFIEKARKSNAFLIIENCGTEEKAREIRAELYSGAMAFSAKRSEEEEFVFCLEGGIVLEDEEKGANATSIQGGEEKKENGKNKKNEGGGLFASGSEDSDSLSSDEEDVARIERLSINNINDRDIATCKRAQANISNAFRAMCLERAESIALRYAPMRERIYAKLKEKAKAKKKEEKEKKSNQQKRFDVSNDEPVRMPANASSPLVKKSNFQIIENNNELASAKKDGPGVMSFLDWMGGDGNDEVPLSEQKGISYQSKADAARIKALEAALRELNPDHPLLMFCPAPKT